MNSGYKVIIVVIKSFKPGVIGGNFQFFPTFLECETIYLCWGQEKGHDSVYQIK